MTDIQLLSLEKTIFFATMFLCCARGTSAGFVAAVSALVYAIFINIFGLV